MNGAFYYYISVVTDLRPFTTYASPFRWFLELFAVGATGASSTALLRDVEVRRAGPKMMARLAGVMRFRSE